MILHRKQRVVNNLNASSESKIETPSMNKIILHQKYTRCFYSHQLMVWKTRQTPFDNTIRNQSRSINATREYKSRYLIVKRVTKDLVVKQKPESYAIHIAMLL